MKLTRIKNSSGTITPGVMVSDSEILDCSGFGQDWNEAFFENDGLEKLKVWLESNQDAPRSVSYTHLTLPTNREV